MSGEDMPRGIQGTLAPNVATNGPHQTPLGTQTNSISQFIKLSML